MLTLSIQQPWPWAMFYAGKDVENRSWYTPVRGWFLIHAGKRYDQEGHECIEDTFGLSIPKDLPRGGIVGVAEIYGCVKSYDSKWFFGPWGFLVRNQVPRPLMPLKGQLKFFEAEYRAAA